ncbi:MAG TPA: diacylglycerol kinase family protein [Chloroflexia bacterium]|nr:diacylglycerol kinase family protein [Chloroflexia bacterium]
MENKALLVVNPKAGTGMNGNSLIKLLEAADEIPGLEIHLIKKGENIIELVQKAVKQGVTVVGAAGGDGTINAVATALVGQNVPLVVIPFGTLNHFARDIDIPKEPVAALALFDSASSREIKVDVGTVNNHIFLNNSSIGLYPRLVAAREIRQKKDNMKKWPAYLLAGWYVLRHPQPARVRVALGKADPAQTMKVGLIFIANNKVEMSPLRAGKRLVLDGKLLDIYIFKVTSSFPLFRLAAAFLRNKLEASPTVDNLQTESIRLNFNRQRVRVACDGEVFTLRPPLDYQIQPSGLTLRVLLPDEPQDVNEKH